MRQHSQKGDALQTGVCAEAASLELRRRAARNFRRSYESLTAQVDRMFAWLLVAEWIGMIAVAWIVAPRTWSGSESSLHPHLWAAVLAGPACILPAVTLAICYPTRQLTRHVIAIAQMLVSSLLIDVTGGRIETHFHIFGSLAFLAFYRDWRVLITASALTALDHLFRGIWWPQSVYGVLTVSPWRSLEHAWWVIFEDFFLIIAIRRSIREMWEAATSKARLHAGAYHDVLTGLANRRLLQESFDREWKSAGNSGGAVLFIDLDRFKQANDTLGHGVGDKLLVLVAQRLTKALDTSSTLARIGGDEFVVLLKAASGEDAMAVGSQLLGALSSPFDVDGHQLLLSASVGISRYPEHGRNLGILQERADQAMYIAKSQGRNQCILFSPEITAYEEKLKDIGRDLYGALPNGELQVYFQPLIEKGAKLTAFEALLRWKHPVHGWIPPSDFIPLAESSGLIVGFGDWVLREACRNCVAWQQFGKGEIGVAVNVSVLQLEQPGFAKQVIETLRELRLDPSLLTLEITESVLIKDQTLTRRQLTELRQTGVQIAIDDFGTGYSSLNYLMTLPADTVKLDRAFLSRELTNASAIIESVIEMAHRVGLRVVGEGVETGGQMDRLLCMNCDQLQGYYFSPPMPASSVAGYVQPQIAAGALEGSVLEAEILCQ